MPITIGSNISSLRTVRTLDRTSSDLSNVFQRLSSGQRITRASDDAAGLSIASSLNVKSLVFAQGIRNVNDGISLMAIAEGALGTLSDIVTRVGELSEQAANGTFSAKQRVVLDKEADTLLREYNRIIQSTTFNGMKILDGSEDVVTLQHGGDEMVTRLEVGYQLGDAAGDGTFSSAVSFAGGDARYALAADFNNDGYDDVAVGIWPGSSRVFISNGNGTFAAPTTVNAGGFGLNAGDFNNDGILDLVGVNYSGGSVMVALGNGNGTFRASQQNAVGGILQDTAILDVNNDGRLDLLANLGSIGTVSILIGNGNGTFGSPTSYTNAAASWGAPMTEVGDVNGDGITDLVSFRVGIRILFGNADGTFTSASTIPTGPNLTDGQLADLNGDGILDIAASDTIGGIITLLGNGNGSFQSARTFTIGTGAMSLRMGDVNGDGVLDIISSAGGTNGGVSVLLGNGDGSFAARSSFSLSAGVTQTGISLGDFNGDGVLDVVGSHSSGFSMILGNADSSGRRNNFVYDVDLLTIHGARSALDWSKKQQTSISRELGMLGAYQSRLQATLSVLDTTRINSLAASTRITDADIVAESADLVRLQILQQSGQSILAQANLQPQIALQLLRGL